MKFNSAEKLSTVWGYRYHLRFYLFRVVFDGINTDDRFLMLLFNFLL